MSAIFVLEMEQLVWVVMEFHLANNWIDVECVEEMALLVTISVHTTAVRSAS